MRKCWLIVLAAALALGSTTPTVAEAPVTKVTARTGADVPLQPKVSNTLRALDRLHQYGYTWTSDAGALKAIRHWQHANGLTVDGDVGTETLRSLNLPATASTGAVRLNPPAPAVTQPSGPVTEDDIKQMIRDVWPDNLEDRAIQIGYRESRYVPTVRTWCCFGILQVHKQHLAWLCPLMGVCTTDQLYDPLTNIQAAYALYERVDEANGDKGSGWSPWSIS